MIRAGGRQASRRTVQDIQKVSGEHPRHIEASRRTHENQSCRCLEGR